MIKTTKQREYVTTYDLTDPQVTNMLNNGWKLTYQGHVNGVFVRSFVRKVPVLRPMEAQKLHMLQDSAD